MTAAETKRERPFPCSVDERPCTLFFNGEPMPEHAELWWTCVEPLHDITREQGVGWADVVDVVWGLESVGKVESCPPAMFVHAVQGLILYALENEDHVRELLLENESSRKTAADVFAGLLAGAFQMRELALARRLAIWSVGYPERDLPELMAELVAAKELPEDFPLQPHNRGRLCSLKFRLQIQAKRFHQLSQSGRFTKELRGQCHSISVPEDTFLRLIF